MFERFTDGARRVVVFAQDQARSLGHGYIGTEHLLMGIAVGAPDSVAGRALVELGAGLDDVRQRAVALASPGPGAADAEALETIGIDLEAVRRRVEDAFGPGALDRAARRRGWGRSRRRRHSGSIPFTSQAQEALELSLREALRLNHRGIGPEHLLLGILRQGRGAGARALRGLGVTAGQAEAKILELLRQAS